MPIYEYRCQKCAHEYEKREGFDAPAQQRCPKCRGKALRVLHAAPIVFKGSGFYVTDNRKASPTEHDSKQSSTDGASSASEDGASSASEDGAGASSKEGASAKSSDDSSKSAEPAAAS